MTSLNTRHYVLPLAFLLVMGAGLPGQEQRCDAAVRSGFARLWPSDSIRGQARPDTIGFQAMQVRLAGQYQLLTIATEGTGRGKWATVSRLTIVPRATVDTSRRIGYVRNIIAEGRTEIQREGYLHQSVPKVRSRAPIWYRVTYVAPHKLELFAVRDSASLDVQGNDSPGPALVVGHIGLDGTLYGRWQATGIEVMSSRSPVGELVEGEQGYFCAWRVR